MSTPQQPRRKLGGEKSDKMRSHGLRFSPGKEFEAQATQISATQGKLWVVGGFFSSFGGGNTPCHSSFFCSPATSAHLEQCRAHFFLGGGGGQASNLCLSFLWDSRCRRRCQRDRNRIVGPLFSAFT